MTVCLLAFAGCGERHAGSPVTGAAPAPAPSSASGIALAREPRRAREVVITGDGAPRAHGPYTFRGRYRVRFEQVDPEDLGQTFTAQTSFVAVAAPGEDQDSGAGVVRLVRAATRTGSATVRLDGRLWVNVSFGDFPYAVRLTPAGGG